MKYEKVKVLKRCENKFFLLDYFYIANKLMNHKAMVNHYYTIFRLLTKNSILPDIE